MRGFRAKRVVKLTSKEMEWQREGTTYSVGTWGSDYRHFVKSECPESQQIGIAPKAE